MIIDMILGFVLGFGILIIWYMIYESSNKKFIKKLKRNNVSDSDIINILLEK